MPTLNPVPSQDPSDLLFNAQKLDQFVNSTANSFTDRLGNDRVTLDKAIRDIVAGASTANTFDTRLSGDGSTTAFTLPWSVPHEKLLDVEIGGIGQSRATYSVAGAILTFDEAPPAGTLNMQVTMRSGAVVSIGEADATEIDYTTFSGQQTTAHDALRTLEQGSGGYKMLADAFKKGTDGGAVSIALYGTSITYSQDTTETGTNPPINSAPQARSSTPIDVKLAEALSFSGITASVINRGYPGDRTIEGVSRWVAASATDVSFVEYGHNDAMNYGGYVTGPVSMDAYRTNLTAIIKRELDKGAAVVVVGSTPVADTKANLKIRAYAQAAKQIADGFGLPFVDWAEIIETVNDKWTDNVHLSPTAYAEIGWQLAGLFYRRDAAVHRVSPGDWFNANDSLGRGGSRYAWTPAKQGGAIIQLNAGQSYAVGVHVVSDCVPVIHTVNTSGSPFKLNCYYAGSPSGIMPVTGLKHDQSFGTRQKFTGQLLKGGLRSFVIRNDGATTAYIEAIEFRGAEHVSFSRGLVTKSSLSGVHQSALFSAAASSWWSAADYTRKLTADCMLVAHVTLTDTHQCGIGIARYRQQSAAAEIQSADSILALRSGTDLIIRQLINGSASGDVTVAAIFSVGSYTGELGILLTTVSGTTTAYVTVDGTIRGSRVVTQTEGYPMVIGNKNARMVCHSMQFNGEVKAAY